MPYNFAADSFHTNKLCSTLSSSEVHFLYRNYKLSPLRPPLGGLGVTYDVHLRLIGKLAGDFLLVIIELFSIGAFVLSQYTRLTDEQTDRQKLDRKDHPAYMQRGKKGRDISYCQLTG